MSEKSEKDAPNKEFLPENIVAIIEKIPIYKRDLLCDALGVFHARFLMVNKNEIDKNVLEAHLHYLKEYIRNEDDIKCLLEYIGIKMDEQSYRLTAKTFEELFWNIDRLRRQIIELIPEDERAPLPATGDLQILSPSSQEVDGILSAAKQKLQAEIHGQPLTFPSKSKDKQNDPMNIPRYLQKRMSEINNGDLLTEGTIMFDSGYVILRTNDGNKWKSIFLFGQYQHGTKVRVYKTHYGVKVTTLKKGET